jgi:hypothetical protein
MPSQPPRRTTCLHEQGALDTNSSTWRQHPYTRKAHLFLGAHPYRALCGTLTFHTAYRPNAPSAQCSRCVRAAYRLPRAATACTDARLA